jgi:hypothetical protein
MFGGGKKGPSFPGPTCFTLEVDPQTEFNLSG